MTWNPLDWTAVPFLTLYVALAIIVLSLGFSFRRMIGSAAANTRELTILELAYLGGGAKRVGDAVLLCLTSRNGASIDPKGHKITVSDQTSLSDLVDRPTRLQVRPNMTRQQFQKVVKPLVERIRDSLRKVGYTPTDDQMMTFRVTFLSFIALILLLGISKAIVGAERGHSVGFLIALLVMTAVVGLLLAAPPTRTRAGNDALERYRASNARAVRAPLEHELLFAVALSGAVVLSGTSYASVYAASQTMNSSSGGDGGGGCGGGGCGGCS
jgi:uncharacterized protein (TIGR04222 family)